MTADIWRRLLRASLTLLVGAGLVAACTVDLEESTSGSPSAPSAVSDDPSDPSTASRSLTSSTTAPSSPASTAPDSTAPASGTPSATSSPTAPGRPGMFMVAPGEGDQGVGPGTLVTYTVAVEESLWLDPAAVAEVVDRTLSDQRSWAAEGKIRFQRVERDGFLQIVIASPPTVDARCEPMETFGLYSCRLGREVNINSDRWLGATDDWPLDVEEYRNYVVNHEVGHALGHGHEFCGGEGTLAPVMMQQTAGLESCAANPWPFPDRAPGPIARLDR